MLGLSQWGKIGYHKFGNAVDFGQMIPYVGKNNIKENNKMALL